MSQNAFTITTIPSRSGSVLSIMELLFDNKMTNRLNLLNVAVSNGSLGALKVDASYKSKGKFAAVIVEISISPVQLSI